MKRTLTLLFIGLLIATGVTQTFGQESSISSLPQFRASSTTIVPRDVSKTLTLPYLATSTTNRVSADANGTLNLDTSSIGGGGARYTVASSGGDFTSIASAASAACAASPAGGTVYVKAGTYTESTTTVGCTNLRITLDQAAVWQVNGASVSPAFNAPSGASRIIIEGGKLLQTNATAQGTALDMSNLANTWVRNMRIEEFGVGVKYVDTANTTFYNSLTDMQFFNDNNCVQYSGSQPNNNTMDNVRCRPKAGGAGTGLSVMDTRGLTVKNSDFEPASSSSITGISIASTSREITILNTWIENNQTGLSIESGANRVTVIGSSITSNTTDVSDSGTQTVFLNTSLTGTLRNQIGTVSSGLWNGTAIGAQYGGTGLNTSASTGFPSLTSGTWAVNSTSTQRALLGAGLSLDGAASLASAVDATVYYGGLPPQAPSTIEGLHRFYVPRDGTIKWANILFVTTAGTSTAETSTVALRLNATTDTVLSTNVVNGALNVPFVVSADLSIPVVRGDFFEIKWTTPTWATNPTTVSIQNTIYIE